MKSLIDLFNYHEKSEIKSEWSVNVLRLKRAFENDIAVEFTDEKYIHRIESLILEYTFKDTKTVVECLACIHDISETKAKLLLATKMSEIIQNISKED